MSGQDILIEQFWEELEKAHAASEYQTRRIEHYRTQLDFCERRAEKAERERDEARAEREREERLEALGRAVVEASRFFQDADDIALSEDVTIWEDDCHGGDHRTVLIMDDNQHALLADVSEAVATYREETAGVDVRSDEIKELRKRAEKAERERDEARAERDARPDISAEDALLMEDARATLELPAYEHGPEHQDAAMRIARALRAHAAKAGKP